MQIRRNENLLFPNFKTNVVSNHKFLGGTNVVKKDISATVTISNEGRAKARMLNESFKKDDYMKHAESKIMAYMQEKEYDEEIIEMVEEYGEDEEEKELKENSETEETAESEMDEQKINLNVGEKPIDETALEDGNLKKKAMKMMEDIENQMNDVEEASNKSRKKENDFAKSLEEDYKRIQQVVHSDEVSVKDKVKAYDRFVEEAGINARGREVERIKKQFDAETLMMARIMALAQNQMGHMLNGTASHSQMGTEFIKSFLI